MSKIKIGALVRANLPQLLEYCTHVDPTEVTRLSDLEYSRDAFGIPFPFFQTPAEAELQKKVTGKSRYWNTTYSVLGHELRLTNHWFERNRKKFLFYLVEKGLTPIETEPGEVASGVEDAAASETVTTLKGAAKYKLHAIGNAQNSAVRYTLGNLQHEPFSAKDWIAVKERFGFRCVYCGTGQNLVMDHAVPINQSHLGEHRLGNLVPACAQCNSAKGQKRHDEFLRQSAPERADDRIRAIQAHMAHHGYVPLTEALDRNGAKEVRAILTELRDSIAKASVDAAQRIMEIQSEQ